MIQKVQNTVTITCTSVDFTTATDIEVFVKYRGFSKTYSPTVVSSTQIKITIPKNDTMMWQADDDVEIQFALTDSSGAPVVSSVRSMTISELIRDSGYGD